ncbi:MAG: glycosyltransferase family 4 protein [Actinobacteria bacterium]|nr:glycosyltransferase family 4 protein [Actinomycetota bacterium]
MKILFDHQIFEMQLYGGISRYFYELISKINETKLCEFNLSIKYSSNQYLKNDTFFKEKIKDLKKYVEFLPNIEFKGKGIIYKLLRSIGFVDFHYSANENYSINNIKKGNFDVFHPTYYKNYFLNYIKSKPFVLTVFDLIPEIFPQYAKDELFFLESKKILLKKAKRIIAISQNTKKDIINYYDINDENINVIYLGSSLNSLIDFKKINKYFLNKVPSRYILFVGNRQGYKNFNFFIESIYSLLIKDKSLNIVCAGGNNFSNEELILFNKFKIIDRIFYFEVNNDILKYLYSNALVFVFPSLYEGFGIPILEAFSCNCPIVLSNSSSFPEVAGDAAIYFDLKDKESLIEAIKSIINNDDLRQELITKGKNRVKEFSWEKTMKETISVYKSII